MPNQEEIANQLNLLRTHRQTLVSLLRQQAIFADSFTPPYVLHDIRETRRHIYHIKNTLKQWNIPIEDQPGDSEEITALPFVSETYRSNQLISLRGKIKVAYVNDAAVPGASGIYYYLILGKPVKIEPDDEALKIETDATDIVLKEIQIMTNYLEHTLKNSGYQVPDLSKIDDRTVVISGQLIPRHTGHHRTPYILFADSIEIR